VIRSRTFSLLTCAAGRSIPAAEIDVAAAKAALASAEQQEAGNADLAAIKAKAVAQARAQIRMVENA